MNKPKILVFASGGKDGGGSGFQEMVEQSRVSPPILDAQIVGVVSNHENGGVYQKAKKLNIPFRYWSGPYVAEEYRRMVEEFGADYVMLSGWLKLVKGLNPTKTVNIHPGPLPKFGGAGMYGVNIHRAVIEAYKKGEITQTEVNIHFATEEYDQGPIFFRHPVFIRNDDTPETLSKRVNEVERTWQSYMLNKVVNREIFSVYVDNKWMVIGRKKY